MLLDNIKVNAIISEIDLNRRLLERFEYAEEYDQLKHRDMFLETIPMAREHLISIANTKPNSAFNPAKPYKLKLHFYRDSYSGIITYEEQDEVSLSRQYHVFNIDRELFSIRFKINNENQLKLTYKVNEKRLVSLETTEYEGMPMDDKALLYTIISMLYSKEELCNVFSESIFQRPTNEVISKDIVEESAFNVVHVFQEMYELVSRGIQNICHEYKELVAKLPFADQVSRIAPTGFQKIATL